MATRATGSGRKAISHLAKPPAADALAPSPSGVGVGLVLQAGR